MPMFRAWAGSFQPLRTAALAAAAVLLALATAASPGTLRPSAALAAAAADAGPAAAAREGEQGHWGARQVPVAEVATRPSDARPSGPPPSPAAVLDPAPPAGAPASRAAAALLADQRPVFTQPPPFHGRAPPLT